MSYGMNQGVTNWNSGAPMGVPPPPPPVSEPEHILRARELQKQREEKTAAMQSRILGALAVTTEFTAEQRAQQEAQQLVERERALQEKIREEEQRRLEAQADAERKRQLDLLEAQVAEQERLAKEQKEAEAARQRAAAAHTRLQRHADAQEARESEAAKQSARERELAELQRKLEARKAAMESGAGLAVDPLEARKRANAEAAAATAVDRSQPYAAARPLRPEDGVPPPPPPTNCVTNNAGGSPAAGGGGGGGGPGGGGARAANGNFASWALQQPPPAPPTEPAETKTNASGAEFDNDASRWGNANDPAFWGVSTTSPPQPAQPERNTPAVHGNSSDEWVPPPPPPQPTLAASPPAHQYSNPVMEETPRTQEELERAYGRAKRMMEGKRDDVDAGAGGAHVAASAAPTSSHELPQVTAATSVAAAPAGVHVGSSNGWTYSSDVPEDHDYAPVSDYTGAYGSATAGTTSSGNGTARNAALPQTKGKEDSPREWSFEQEQRHQAQYGGGSGGGEYDVGDVMGVGLDNSGPAYADNINDSGVSDEMVGDVTGGGGFGQGRGADGHGSGGQSDRSVRFSKRLDRLDRNKNAPAQYHGDDRGGVEKNKGHDSGEETLGDQLRDVGSKVGDAATSLTTSLFGLFSSGDDKAGDKRAAMRPRSYDGNANSGRDNASGQQVEAPRDRCGCLAPVKWGL